MTSPMPEDSPSKRPETDAGQQFSSTSGSAGRVLLVSYVFPPMAAVGIYRVVKFCKYLPDAGWNPSVLTVRHGANWSYDPSQLDKLAPDLPIYRSGNWEPLVWWERVSSKPETAPAATGETKAATPTAEPPRPSFFTRFKRGLRRLISTPDSNVYWVPFGLVTGLRAIRREKIDVLVSTSPPASTHVLAYLLSKLSGKPLVVDFRDLWTQNESYELSDRPQFVRKLDRALERKVLRRASAIVTATEPFAELVRTNNPEIAPERVVAITNGLDPDDFADIEYPTEKNSKFMILHLGSLYGHRNPQFFFEALRALLKQRPEIAGEIEIQFIGNVPGWDTALEGTPLADIVQWLGHMPQAKALNKLWEADLLLLILGFSDSTGATIPAKLFEYIATGRPILGFVPQGEARRLMEKYEVGRAISEPDIESTVNFLSTEFDKWKAREGAPSTRFSLPAEFDRRAQAAALAEILTAAKQQR